MGKALIFSGVIIDSPLQTVTFVKELITAQDYVNEYVKLATEVTSSQQTYLTTFVETLMANGIWDKVRCCFPMLGGLNGYNKDLKDVNNQREWSTPSSGTSWDSTRNAPYLNLPGNAKGTSLVIENMDKHNSTFLFSCKLHSNVKGDLITSQGYGGESLNPSIISNLGGNVGGNRSPYWGTERAAENLEGYSYFKNDDNIYIVTMSAGTNSMFVCCNSYDILTWKTGDTTSDEATDANFGFGSRFLAESAAPATNTLNGTMNMFIAFSEALSENELKIVSKAVWDFDEACGRHIDFD